MLERMKASYIRTKQAELSLGSWASLKQRVGLVRKSVVMWEKSHSLKYHKKPKRICKSFVFPLKYT